MHGFSGLTAIPAMQVAQVAPHRLFFACLRHTESFQASSFYKACTALCIDNELVRLAPA